MVKYYDRSQVYKIGRIKNTNTMKNEEIRQNIISLLRSTGRQGIEATIAYLERSNYFRARCHSHHRHFGGLARHSLEACGYALANAGDIPAGSVIIATLLHDVCTSRARDTVWIQGHGRRSVRILEAICGLDLNRDEREAILLHMHGRAPQMKTNRLAALVNRADHVSAGGHWRLRESA